MTLEEKRKEFELYLLSDECGWVDGREWMMGAHEINNLWQWIETKIDEACKEQREICADAFMTKEDYLYIKLNTPDTISTLKRDEILNAPSPKEND